MNFCRNDARVLLLAARAAAEARSCAAARGVNGAQELSEKAAAEAVCQVFTNSLEYEHLLPVASACAGSAAQQGSPDTAACTQCCPVCAVIWHCAHGKQARQAHNILSGLKSLCFCEVIMGTYTERALSWLLEEPDRAWHAGDPPAVMYQLASRFNHSCRANAAYHFKPGATIAVRTLVDVEADQEICVSYVDPLQAFPA